MWSIIAASVVLLPEPVVPVTSTRPRSSSAMRFRTSGSSSASTDGTFVEMTRMTSEMVPRCVKTLQRKRPSPGMLYAASIS